MIKAILFDLDGVVMVGREKYYSVRYAEEHDVPIEHVNEFFLGPFRKCVFGSCDLKEEIEPFLSKWKWTGTTEEFLDKWFAAESKVDETVLATIDALRAKGYRCYIASRQEKYRLAYLLDTVGLRAHFDGYFSTCDIGFDKHEPAYWHYVRAELGVAPEEILFLDDAQKNIDYARSIGVDAHFYDGRAVLERELAKLT